MLHILDTYLFKILELLSQAEQSAIWLWPGAYFLVCMVYLKVYSLAVEKITITIVMIDDREYYKNINPQGLSDNYSFAILSASVMICHT